MVQGDLCSLNSKPTLADSKFFFFLSARRQIVNAKFTVL